MARSGRVQQSRRRGSSAGFAARLTALAVVAALVATLAPAVPRSAPAEADTSPFGVYRPITPKRLHDTNVAGWGTIDLKVTGGTSGVPEPSAGTKAVALEVTAFPVTTGYGLVYEQGTPRPATSSLNYIPGEYVTNLVTVKPSAGGNISYYSALSNARVVVDVIGYYEASGTGAGYAPVSPARIFDTRPNLVPANTVTNVKLRGLGGVPDDPRVVATTVMITVTGASADGFLTVYPPGTNPGTASMSFSAGKTQTSTVIAKLGPSGYASIYNMLSPVTLTIDVVGYEMDGSGARFRPSAGQRILDTRNGTGGHLGALGPCQQVDSAITGVGGVPSERVTAVAVNLTAVLPSSPGSVTAWSTGSPQPAVTSVSFTDTTNDVANLVFLQPGSANKASFATSCSASSTHVVADVVGYFLQGGDPFGSLDSATGHAGGVDVRGWATDADTADPIDVQVSVDGALAGTTRASEGRPDLTAAYPDYGAAHGFSFFAAAAAGTNHNVCATAVNVYSGANKALGCRGVDVTAADAPGGAVIVFTPDGAGFRPPPDFDATLVVNGSGHRLTMMGDKSSWDFDGGGRAVAQRGPNDDLQLHRNTISFTYGAPGAQLSSVTDSRGRAVTFAYNGAGRLGSMTDVANGRVFTYGYDPAGRLLETIIGPPLVAGGPPLVTTFGYVGDNLSSVTDAQGHVTTIEYWPDDRVKFVKRDIPEPTGTNKPTTGFTYYPKGAQTCVNAGFGTANPCTRVADPRHSDTNSMLTTYKFDAQGNHRVEKVKDALGRERSTQYNSSGNVTNYADALGAVSTLDYDPTGHAVTASKLPTGASSTYNYGDTANNPRRPTGVTDAQNNTTGFVYDGAGNTKSVSANRESDPYYSFDYNTAEGTRKDGTVKWAKDPVEPGRPAVYTNFSYDDKGQRTGVDHPAPLGDETFTYDNASRVSSHTDGLGRLTSYEYDAYDRVTKTTYADAAVISYTYDAAGNRKMMVDQSGPSTYDYDKLNRLKTQTLPGLRTNSYDYDDSGNLAGYADAAGSVTYGHNTLNLVDRVTEPGGYATTISYDDANRRDKVSYPNGVVQDVDYDTSGRTRSVKATKGSATLTSFAYTYDKSGADSTLRQSMAENVPGVVNDKTTYAYDGLDRLDTASTTTQPSGPAVHSYDYDYDRRSNRTKATVDGGVIHYAYNDASERPRRRLLRQPPGRVQRPRLRHRGQPQDQLGRPVAQLQRQEPDHLHDAPRWCGQHPCLHRRHPGQPHPGREHQPHQLRPGGLLRLPGAASPSHLHHGVDPRRPGKPHLPAQPRRPRRQPGARPPLLPHRRAGLGGGHDR